MSSHHRRPQHDNSGEPTPPMPAVDEIVKMSGVTVERVSEWTFRIRAPHGRQLIRRKKGDPAAAYAKALEAAGELARNLHPVPVVRGLQPRGITGHTEVADGSGTFMNAYRQAEALIARRLDAYHERCDNCLMWAKIRQLLKKDKLA